MGVRVERRSYLISPLISLRAVSIIFGSLGDWVIYPRELSLGYSARSLIV